MGMNAKEAREFLKKIHIPGSIFPCDDPRTFNMDKEIGRAEGYLAALEGEEVRALVEALKKQLSKGAHGDKWRTIADKEAVEALAAFNKAVKP